MPQFPEGIAALRGWKIGLEAAGYLRTYFYDFWAEHVAHEFLTVERLRGCTHAFVLLGHHHLLALSPYMSEFDLRYPSTSAAHLMNAYNTGYGSHAENLHDAGWILTNPPAEVYGQAIEARMEIWDQGADRLGSAISTMFRYTAWGWSGRWVYTHPDLPAIPCRIDLDTLTDHLIWRPPGCVFPLGMVIRYIFGDTGNRYADFSDDEVAADGTWWLNDIYRHPDRLGEEIQMQRAAKSLAETATDLAQRCDTDPALLAAISTQISHMAERIHPSKENAACAA